VGHVLRLVAAAAVLVATPVAPAAVSAPFFVGFSEDLPKEIGSAAVVPAAALGGSAFRLTTLWTPGQTALTAWETEKLDRAVAARAGQRYLLSVFADAGSKAPQTAAARDEYCTYVRTVLTRYPAVRAVVIWNEPNLGFFWSPQVDATGAPVAAARYTALLARCYDVLHAAFPAVNVIGLALSSSGNDNSGSASPGQFIRDVGVAYRSSGRTKPLMDTVAHHPYGAFPTERPWRKHIGSKRIGLGDWNKLMYNLHLAFDGTGQPLPGEGSTSLWYTEWGVQTAVATVKAASYHGTENAPTLPDYTGGEPATPTPGEATEAPDLYTQALDAARLAACQPDVGAFFNFLLADEPHLAGWQSGPLWADLTPKASAEAYRQAFAEATAGAVDCAALKGGPPSADHLPPSPPTAVGATGAVEPLRVELTWSGAADETGVTAYRVYRDGAHVATTPGDTTWINVSVLPQTTYSYVVRALDAAGNLGNASPAASVTTPEAVPPNAPPSLSAHAPKPGRVELAWEPASDNVGVVRYEILRDGAVVGSTTGTTWVEDGLYDGVTYSYGVVAVDAAGNHGAAANATVSTPEESPASVARRTPPPPPEIGIPERRWPAPIGPGP
jgi:chitodextrinase